MEHIVDPIHRSLLIIIRHSPCMLFCNCARLLRLVRLARLYERCIINICFMPQNQNSKCTNCGALLDNLTRCRQQQHRDNLCPKRKFRKLGRRLGPGCARCDHVTFDCDTHFILYTPAVTKVLRVDVRMLSVFLCLSLCGSFYMQR